MRGVGLTRLGLRLVFHFLVGYLYVRQRCAQLKVPHAIYLVLLEDLNFEDSIYQAVRAILECLHWIYLDHVEILLALVVAAEAVAATSLVVVLALIHKLINSLLDIVVSSNAEIVQDVNNLASVHVCDRDGAVLRASNQVAARVGGDGLR